MLRHYLTAAWRDLMASRLQSIIAIIGLAVGIAAAVTAAAVIRNQTSADHFIPGYARTYLHIHSYQGLNGTPEWYTDDDPKFAPALKLVSPEIEGAVRLCADQKSFHHGDVTADEQFYWTDASLAAVLPLPVYRGDLKTALTRPGDVVLTRSLARKYFGTDEVIGRALTIEGQPMIVRAVLQDLHNTSLGLAAPRKLGFPNSNAFTEAGVFALGCDKDYNGERSTYIRLKPGASIAAVQARSAGVYSALFKPAPGRPQRQFYYWVPIDRANLHPGLHPGMANMLRVMGAAAVLILLLAVMNFISLALARSGRRAVEVGVRKASGASRCQLMAQFLGEAVFSALLAGVLAFAMAEWFLPAVNAFLGADAALDDWRDIGFALALLSGIALVGVLAGAYPAFVLSALRPALVMKGLGTRLFQAMVVRNIMVVTQFAFLVLLFAAMGTLYLQRQFAVGAATRAMTGNKWLMEASCQAFRDEVRTLPGVAADECSDLMFLSAPMGQTNVTFRGASVPITLAHADPGVFGIYGIKPLAGMLSDMATPSGSNVAINEAGRKAMGLKTNAEAIGQTAAIAPGDINGNAPATYRIVAVVPDFSFYSAQTPIRAALYAPQSQRMNPPEWPPVYNNIRLTGRDVAQTIAAIDTLAERLSPLKRKPGRKGALPRDTYFLDSHIRDLYRDILRQEQDVAVFSMLGLTLACLGLYALCASLAERRIKEIGIRKAMGARNRDILVLLLAQFTTPVLWANLIAWPIALWAMNRWLAGFAYHVALPLWLLPAVGAVTLLIALATVAGQALLVARQKPVLALRYE